MAQDLFRPEAVEFSTQRLYGQVVVRPRLSHLVIVGVLVTCVSLLALTLALGTHLEKRRVTGELAVHVSGATASIHALLYAPKTLSKLITVGQRVQLEVVGFDMQVGNVAASIAQVSAQSKVRQPNGTVGGTVYVPVMLAVSESALASAGLPIESDYSLNVATDLIISRQSWLHWLIGNVLRSERPTQA